jgi:PAS domain S-box-containing protein
VLLFLEQRVGRSLASAEAAMRASEHRFATFIEKGPAICSVKDENGAYVYINQQLANQFGTRQEDWIGRTDLELFPEEVARTFQENDLAVLKSGATSVVTEVAPALNGTKAYWLSYKFRLLDEAGRSYVGGMSINVTEQKRMEAELGVSSERYRDLIENASDLIQSVSPDGHFLFVNRAWRETLGYSEVELNGLFFFSVVDEDRQEECRDMFHQVFAGKTGVRIETVFVASDNRKISVEGTSDCEVEGGQVVSVRSIFRDITKRKQAEAEREKLLQELEATVASVKKLGAL